MFFLVMLLKVLRPEMSSPSHLWSQCAAWGRSPGHEVEQVCVVTAHSLVFGGVHPELAIISHLGNMDSLFLE